MAEPRVWLGLDPGSSRLCWVDSRSPTTVMEQAATLHPTPDGGWTGRHLPGVSETELREPLVGDEPDWTGLERLFHDTALGAAWMEGGRDGRSRTRVGVVLALPAGTRDTLRRAWSASLQRVGAAAVRTVPTAVCAALGAQLPADAPVASLIVHLGAARTEIAWVSWTGVIAHQQVPLGGRVLDRALLSWFRDQHRLLLPRASAEQMRIHALGARPGSLSSPLWVTGYGIPSGAQRSVSVDPTELHSQLEPSWGRLLDAITTVLEGASATAAADLLHAGILLTGGLAHTRGLDARVAEQTGIPTFAADDAAQAVALGLGRLLSTPTLLDRAEALFDLRREGSGATRS